MLGLSEVWFRHLTYTERETIVPKITPIVPKTIVPKIKTELYNDAVKATLVKYSFV